MEAALRSLILKATLFCNSIEDRLVSEVNKDKDKNYTNLVKIVSPSNVRKVYEKSIKGYIYEIDQGLSTRIQLPKEDKFELGLVQQYLIIQLYLYPSKAFSLELALTDTSKTRRRIFLTSAVSKIDLNFFHVKVPIDVIQRETWLNLCIDVLSFMEPFKGQTFRSLDTIIIGANCKLRKIFTMKNPIFENYFEETNSAYDSLHAQEVPKNHNFPAGIQYLNQILTYGMIRSYQLEKHDGVASSNQSDTSQILSRAGLQVIKPIPNFKGASVVSQSGASQALYIEPQQLTKNAPQNLKKSQEGNPGAAFFQPLEKKPGAQALKSSVVKEKAKDGKSSQKKKQPIPNPEAYEIQAWQHEESEQDLHIIISDEEKLEERKHDEELDEAKPVVSKVQAGKKDPYQEPKNQKQSKNPWAGTVGNSKQPGAAANLNNKNEAKIEKPNKKAPLVEKDFKKKNADPTEEYFQQSQKFSSFERTFPSPLRLEVQPEKQNFDKLSNTEEIEENINASGLTKLRVSSEIVSQPPLLAREKSPPVLRESLNLADSLMVDNNSIKKLSVGRDDQFEDSLEASPYRKLHELEHTHPTEDDEEEAAELAGKQALYEEQISAVIDKEFRPYSPPFSINNGKAENRYSNKGNDESDELTLVNPKTSKQQSVKEEREEEKMIDLVYDPVLKCLYDPKTNTYYDVKN